MYKLLQFTDESDILCHSTLTMGNTDDQELGNLLMMTVTVLLVWTDHGFACLIASLIRAPTS